MDWAHDYFEHGYAQRWSLGPDIRWLPVRSGSVHAATLFDAFGFFEHEEQNQAVSTEAGRGHRRHLARHGGDRRAPSKLRLLLRV